LHIRVLCSKILTYTSIAYGDVPADYDDDREGAAAARGNATNRSKMPDGGDSDEHAHSSVDGATVVPLQHWTREDWSELMVNIQEVWRLIQRKDANVFLTGVSRLDRGRVGDTTAISTLPASNLLMYEKVMKLACVHEALAPIRRILENYDGKGHNETGASRKIHDAG